MQKGNTNTILIVIVIILVLGFGFWWYSNRGAMDDGDDAGIELNLGAGGTSEETAN